MKERSALKVNGFLMLVLTLLVLVAGIMQVDAGHVLPGVFCLLAGVIAATGFLIVQPNQAYALVFLGRYLGTIRDDGFWWSFPLTLRKRVSLKVHNFQSDKLKVNDVDGNPIEIAAVIVYRVVDTAKALFDVENYQEFVVTQSEMGLRHIASMYAYDADHEGYTLRGNSDEVAREMQHDLQQRLAIAGVEVLEARLTHLAYAPEIAHAMLQRQQAKAILAARRMVVEGAVGMVQLAIEKLKEDGIVDLDDERKATMANNLMVAIVSERSVQPVVNAGTLF